MHIRPILGSITIPLFLFLSGVSWVILELFGKRHVKFRKTWSCYDVGCKQKGGDNTTWRRPEMTGDWNLKKYLSFVINVYYCRFLKFSRTNIYLAAKLRVKFERIYLDRIYVTLCAVMTTCWCRKTIFIGKYYVLI